GGIRHAPPRLRAAGGRQLRDGRRAGAFGAEEGRGGLPRGVRVTGRPGPSAHRGGARGSALRLARRAHLLLGVYLEKEVASCKSAETRHGPFVSCMFDGATAMRNVTAHHS